MTQSTNNLSVLHTLLQNRWSPRAFQETAVEPEKLRAILEAARWAASSSNEQPWRFIVGDKNRDPEGFQRLLQILVPANQAWAKRAPLLLLSIAKMRTSKDEPNRYAFHDVGQAAAQLTAQATAFDLYVHQMAGFDAAKARETLSIPDAYEPVAVIAVGYKGDPDTLPDHLRARELAARVRQPLTEMIFDGKWGEAAEVADPGS